MLDRKKRIFGKVFLALSSAATVFVLTEIVLQSFGKSICYTEGCKVVAQQVRYGDISILIMGLATFFLLALLSLLEQYRSGPGPGRALNLILIVSLSCEGFFTGYQAFSIHTPCIFCLIILGIVAVLGILRLLSGERELIAGFVSMAAVFSMLYFVLPATATVNLPKESRYLLFYSKECTHCAEVIKKLEESKIAVRHLDISEYAAYLNSMGIDHVPPLMVNDPYQKLFITGKASILQFLLSCNQPQENPVKQERPAKKGKKARIGGKAGSPPAGTGMLNDIFGQPGLLTFPSQSAEDGMCKQDAICK
jgi:hypothetical protein